MASDRGERVARPRQEGSPASPTRLLRLGLPQHADSAAPGGFARREVLKRRQDASLLRQDVTETGDDSEPE